MKESWLDVHNIGLYHSEIFQLVSVSFSVTRMNTFHSKHYKRRRNTVGVPNIIDLFDFLVRDLVHTTSAFLPNLCRG